MSIEPQYNLLELFHTNIEYFNERTPTLFLEKGYLTFSETYHLLQDDFDCPNACLV